MTPEEDPFIVALVADPADEALRLVYSDWLEEHGDDPRAAYVRAEVAHFRTTEGQREHDWTDSPAVDPIWATMVSRMPVGILKPGLKFSDTGPKITRAELKVIEDYWGQPLPADYAAFLLLYNGGNPSKPYLWSYLDDDDYYDEVRFFSTRDTHTDGRLVSLMNPVELVANYDGPDVLAYFERMLPIGTLTSIYDDNTDKENILALVLGDLLPLGCRLVEIEYSRSQGVSFTGNVHAKETFSELLHALVAG